jgi:mRNA interferase MazF
VVTLAVGEVVLVRFPFSDLSQSKLRPAVCLADAGRNDWVLCQITSNAYGDSLAIPLVDPDFVSGGLKTASYVRPGKLFTAHERLIAKSVGKLRDDALRRIADAVVALVRGSVP